jgi:hypothetical protein
MRNTTLHHETIRFRGSDKPRIPEAWFRAAENGGLKLAQIERKARREDMVTFIAGTVFGVFTAAVCCMVGYVLMHDWEKGRMSHGN